MEKEKPKVDWFKRIFGGKQYVDHVETQTCQCDVCATKDDVNLEALLET